MEDGQYGRPILEQVSERARTAEAWDTFPYFKTSPEDSFAPLRWTRIPSRHHLLRVLSYHRSRSRFTRPRYTILLLRVVSAGSPTRCFAGVVLTRECRPFMAVSLADRSYKDLLDEFQIESPSVNLKRDRIR